MSELNFRGGMHKGQMFVLTAKALGIARGSISGAIAWVKAGNLNPSEEAAITESLLHTKGAVTAEGIADYALPTPAIFDMAEFIRPQTIIGKLIGLRKAIARIRQITASGGSVGYWPGAGNPAPLSKLALAGETIEPLAVNALCVATQELLMSAHPDAQSILSRDFSGALIQAMDSSFVDFTNAGVANAKPAAVTYGAPTFHSSGSTAANIDADISARVEALDEAGSDLTFAAICMRPRTALAISTLRGSGGALSYPLMSVKGGQMLGLPVLVSNGVPSSVGSPAEGGSIVVLDASQILVCDDGGGALEVSEHASLQMSDSPSGAAQEVSLFQTGACALKMTRYLNWKVCRTGMVQVIDQVDF